MSALRTPRAFERERDLARIVELFRTQHAVPRDPDWQHPGGMEWWLRLITNDDFRVTVWEESGALAGFVIDAGGYVIARTACCDWSVSRRTCSMAARRCLRSKTPSSNISPMCDRRSSR